MRCVAPVLSPQAMAYRADRGTEKRCRRSGTVLLGGKYFCRAHARVWRKHYEIIERIRAL